MLARRGRGSVRADFSTWRSILDLVKASQMISSCGSAESHRIARNRRRAPPPDGQGIPDESAEESDDRESAEIFEG